MKLSILSLVLLLSAVPALSQEQHLINRTPHIEFAGMTHEQLTKRIFEGERAMISELRASRPVLETYIQSLWTDSEGQSPIDDAYFLSTVNFMRGSEESGDGRPGYQTFLAGQTARSRKIRLNNGDRVAVIPDGYLDMLFIDLEDFDADTYDLSFVHETNCNDSSCLMFSVMPRARISHGRFKGQIWVETSNFKIVRIRGTFTPVKTQHLNLRTLFGVGGIPLYFHFDSTREEVSPGIWLPSYSYFDENRTWQQIDKNASTDLHYRGHILMWGYKDVGVEADANENHKSDLMRRLEQDKLLANAGIVEEGLNSILHRILAANNLDMPAIECRLLLTTPVEMFHVGHTIILSRGLLNIVPDGSVIPVLLTHEIAEMLAEKSVLSTKSDQILWQKTLEMVEHAGYAKGVGYTSLLFAQLAEHSKQIPNLLHPRSGLSLLDIAKGLPKTAAVSSTRQEPPLVLRGNYTINTGSDSLGMRQRGAGITAENLPAI
ncbi:MAG: hypothetical protein ACHP8A_00410 [Terriglobales bacterium]